MLIFRWVDRLVVLFLIAVPAVAQSPPPIADRVDTPLLPTGITELPIELNAQLVHVFKDRDGGDALHCIGDFVLTLGDGDAQQLRASEAVIWLANREYQGRPYRHLQMLLWRNVEVYELAGTVTAAPALFITVSSFGTITTHADDVALSPPSGTLDTEIYRQGNTIRTALASGTFRPTATTALFGIFDPTGLGKDRRKKAAPRPVIHFQSGHLIMDNVNGRRVITMTGGIYLSRGIPASSTFLEIQADAAVVFFAPDEDTPSLAPPLGAGLGGASRADSRSAPPTRSPLTKAPDRDVPDRQLMATGFGDVVVEGAYLEGDVRMSQGSNIIRASRLYYDFQHERALLLDAVVRTVLPGRKLPLFVRAAEIRQLSAQEFSATDAMLTTSEFYTPHYHVGAHKVELINRTPRDPGGDWGGVRAGSFRIRHATLNLAGHPIAYWPFIRGDIDSSETSIKSSRVGFSNDFGVETETEWHLFNVLGFKTPSGFDASLSLDFFSERGPAVGVDADYKRDRYFGEIKSYLMTDNDEDKLGRKREPVSRKDVRGRLLLRHRQYLDDDWQVSLELSYISDRNFLEEFFESEFDNDKEQETLLHLKKQRENWALSILLQRRVLDFTTQTERLPDLAYHLVGQPLGAWGTWFSENRLGVVRFRPADQTFRELLRNGRQFGSGSTARIDTRQEVTIPLNVGAWRVVPFAVGRISAWDDSPRHGGLARGLGMVGVRGSTYLSKVYPDYRSTMFDLDGIRHIIKPDIVAWVSEANQNAGDLFPFDDTVERIADTDGVMIGVRQRWQTKRGADGTRRVVDFMTHDLEVGFFNDAGGKETTNGFTSFSRPENSVSHNYINSSLIWRVNDRTAVLSELNYDINDGEVDVLNVAVSVERTPRFSYLLGYRFIEESNSNLLGFDMNYRMSEKHTLAVRELFDLQRGRTLDFTVALIRRFPGWYGAVSFELDQAEDDFGVSFALWPEGLPQAALGSRRFTGLANTTRIRAD